MQQKKKIPYFKLERVSAGRACRLDGWTFFLFFCWFTIPIRFKYFTNFLNLTSDSFIFFLLIFSYLKPYSLYWAFYWKLNQGRKDWKKSVHLCALNVREQREMCVMWSICFELNVRPHQFDNNYLIQ